MNGCVNNCIFLVSRDVAHRSTLVAWNGSWDLLEAVSTVVDPEDGLQDSGVGLLAQYHVT